MTAEASRRGAANRRKGAQAERDLARYLRVHGWPDARRAREEGWRTAVSVNGDRGDIAGIGPLVLQVKYVDAMSDAAVATARAETQQQRATAGASLGFLIQRRPGKADPGHWWAWIELVDLVTLLFGPKVGGRYTGANSACRFTVADLVCLLHGAGFGEGPR